MKRLKVGPSGSEKKTLGSAYSSGAGFNVRLLGLFILFAVATGLRLLYQQESMVDRPIRADAAVYMEVAEAMYLQREGIGVDQDPFAGVPVRFKRSALYPWFVSWFFEYPGEPYRHVLQRVLLAQAVLGGLTAVLTALIGWAFLPPGWAFGAGLLVTMNPHLMALDGFLLTETLFTFAMMTGTGLMTLALGSGPGRGGVAWFFRGAALAGGLVFFHLSGLIRPLNLLLAPFVASGLLVFLLASRGRILWGYWRHRPVVQCLVVVLLLAGTGLGLALGPARIEEEPGPKKPADAMMNLMVEGGWISFLQGLEPGFYQPGAGTAWNDAAWRNDPAYAVMQTGVAKGWPIVKDRMRERPLDYLAWFLGGKTTFAWRWDNIYNGDVYIYPMTRRGFEEHPWLRTIHTGWRSVHWPVFALAWLAIPLALCSRGSMPAGLPIILVWLYGMVLISVLAPLPRYSIPLRPAGSLLAMVALYSVYKMLLSRLKAKPF